MDNDRGALTFEAQVPFHRYRDIDSWNADMTLQLSDVQLPFLKESLQIAADAGQEWRMEHTRFDFRV